MSENGKVQGSRKDQGACAHGPLSLPGPRVLLRATISLCRHVSVPLCVVLREIEVWRKERNGKKWKQREREKAEHLGVFLICYIWESQS